ncbi:MAG: T9SS type A sorting domain-containing protein [Lewinellaceae bacterium]|nr:T9SS type A sorting domain-containing protein [Lewinellaceae bacterium]
MPAGLAFTSLKEGLSIEKVQPNPASEYINVRWFQAESGDFQLKLNDLNGMPLLQQQGTADRGFQSIQMPLGANIPNGVLLISIENGKERAVQRVVVLR